MPRVSDVIVNFGANTREYNAALSQMDAAINTWGTRVRGGLAGIFAGLGAGSFGASFAEFVDQLDTLGKQAQSLNTTTDALYGLQFAVGQTSTVGRDEFILVLQRINRHLAQAAAGSAESAKIFEDLGVSVDDMLKLDAPERFLAIADAMQKLATNTERTSVSYRLFEEPWRQLQTTLSTPVETIRELMEGVTAPTEEATLAAARLNDSLDLMDHHLQGLAYQVGPPVIDFLNGLIPMLTKAAETTFEFGKKAGDAFERVEEEVRSWGTLGEVIRRIIDPTARFRDLLGDIAEQGRTPVPATVPGGAADGGGILPEVPDAAKTTAAKKSAAEEKKRKTAGVEDTRAEAEEKKRKTAGVEDTRAQIRAEAALWDHYHAELSALQEGSTEAAKEAQKAQVEALSALIAAGASDAREAYYQALVGEDTKPPPSGRMKVVLDEESLLELPDRLEQALQQGNYEVTLRAQVVPTLLEDSALARSVDQQGNTQ